ncbi:MAG TPA: hypothetical protein VJB06_04105 [archaeon]|nr:hypothetical protein [archaeon]
MKQLKLLIVFLLATGSAFAREDLSRSELSAYEEEKQAYLRYLNRRCQEDPSGCRLTPSEAAEKANLNRRCEALRSPGSEIGPCELFTVFAVFYILATQEIRVKETTEKQYPRSDPDPYAETYTGGYADDLAASAKTL